MKIAVFMSNNPTSGWNMGHGIVNTLRRMGHETLCVPMPTEQEADQRKIDHVKSQVPNINDLRSQDAIIVSGPEHIGPWIDLCYGKQPWKEIDVPKAVWLHESTVREDYSIDFDSIKWMGNEWFFPAIQDADFHDQEMFAAGRSHFLPFGVDTEIFKPKTLLDQRYQDKNFDVAFLGMVYQKRAVFLNALRHHKIPPIRNAMCVIQDIRGYDWEGSMRLLAANTREIKVFFNLPSLSRLLVAKVFETMACGTFIMTPELPDDRGADKNMLLFKDKEHLAYYRSSHLGLVAQMLNEWISPEKDAERARIAEAGCREVHEKHSLKIRLEALLSKLKIGVAA